MIKLPKELTIVTPFSKIVALIVLIAAIAVGFRLGILHKERVDLTATQKRIFCTEEVRICPDGSYVGRQHPSCQFAPCPK